MPGSIPEPETTIAPVAPSTPSESDVGAVENGSCDDGLVFINSTGTCSPACYTTIPSLEEDRKLAELFHAILAGATSLSAIGAIIYHWCSSARLSAAEKPVFCILACFILMAGGYIVRLIGGRDIGCGAEGGLVSHDLQNPGCVVVFFLLYYFGLAGHIWWLILVITWFREVIQKKSEKAVKKTTKRAYFFAWIVPFLPTIVILGAKLVDSGEIFNEFLTFCSPETTLKLECFSLNNTEF